MEWREKGKKATSVEYRIIFSVVSHELLIPNASSKEVEFEKRELAEVSFGLELSILLYGRTTRNWLDKLVVCPTQFSSGQQFEAQTAALIAPTVCNEFVCQTKRFCSTQRTCLVFSWNVANYPFATSIYFCWENDVIFQFINYTKESIWVYINHKL
jgi:hypothetical protein